MKIKEEVKKEDNKKTAKVQTKPKTKPASKTEPNKDDGIEVVVDKSFMEAYPSYDVVYVSKIGGIFRKPFDGAIKKIVRTK